MPAVASSPRHQERVTARRCLDRRPADEFKSPVRGHVLCRKQRFLTFRTALRIPPKRELPLLESTFRTEVDRNRVQVSQSPRAGHDNEERARPRNGHLSRKAGIGIGRESCPFGRRRPTNHASAIAYPGNFGTFMHGCRRAGMDAAPFDPRSRLMRTRVVPLHELRPVIGLAGMLTRRVRADAEHDLDADLPKTAGQTPCPQNRSRSRIAALIAGMRGRVPAPDGRPSCARHRESSAQASPHRRPHRGIGTRSPRPRIPKTRSPS